MFSCLLSSLNLFFWEGLVPTSVCRRCGAALRSCVNCAHIDPSARFQCRAAVTEPQSSKVKGNRCQSYSPKVVVEIGGDAKSEDDDPRAAFDALFR